jgi:hypothetical protein
MAHGGHQAIDFIMDGGKDSESHGTGEGRENHSIPARAGRA